MRIEKVVLRLVEMPLKFRFRTSFGEMTAKRFLLVEAMSEGLSGWGECVAEDGPFFSPETIDSARSALARFLVPLVLGRDLADAAAFDRARRTRPREPDGEGGARDGAARPLRPGGRRLARAEPRRDADGDRGRGLARPAADGRGDGRDRAEARGPGVPEDQAEDRAGGRRRPGVGRAGGVPRPPAHGRRERRLHARDLGPAPRARRVRPRLHRAAAPPRGPRGPRASSRGGCRRRSASTSRSARRPTPPRRSRSGRAASST